MEPVYNIPLKFRKMENLHIVFWLFKDVAWFMIWRPLWKFRRKRPHLTGANRPPLCG
jgi:hypothetical protein